ncbi:MAG: lipopolysaccharide biosynthesis protein [Blautia sp.]
MGKGRIEKSIINVIFSMGSSVVILVLSFISRTIFVRTLSTEYLGLNGLFTNILSFLSLAELGVGSALNYTLYKPIKENDIERIKSIMNLYKKLYNAIGIIVLVIGFAITPFLKFFIKEVPDNISYISLYYILFVLNSGLSYFYTYKRALIICNQEEYLSYIITTVCRIFLTVSQIVILLTLKSYMLYLLMAIVFTLVENIAISYISEKKYPYIGERNVEPLPKDYTDRVKKNVIALLFHKIGSAVVFSTDNIIISKFVGLTAVGLYSNYTLIVNSINNILAKVFGTLTASTGELIVSSNKRHMEQIFYDMLFANMWIYGWCGVCFLCLIQPFIVLWLGNEYLMGTSVLIIIVLNFYITGMRKTVWVFKDAAGIYKQDQIKPVVEAMINLIVSIPLAIQMGVSGVLIGTIASNVLWAFWYEAFVLYKYCFESSMKSYVKKQLIYFGVWIVVASISYLICNTLGQGLGYFILKILICIFVPNVLIIAVYCRTSEFRYFKSVVMNVNRKETNK